MKTIYLVANGDLRLSANQMCEPAQAAMEKALVGAIQRAGGTVKRAHPFDKAKGHGFIDSQKMGLEVLRSIPGDAPIVVAEAVWQHLDCDALRLPHPRYTLGSHMQQYYSLMEHSVVT